MSFTAQPPDQLVEDSIEESLQPFVGTKPDTTSGDGPINVFLLAADEQAK
jgi:hypothetical protein